jgi:hypothetical protein
MCILLEGSCSGARARAPTRATTCVRFTNVFFFFFYKINMRSAGYVDFGANLKATRVVAGVAHTCAIVSDGSLYCWGR